MRWYVDKRRGWDYTVKESPGRQAVHLKLGRGGTTSVWNTLNSFINKRVRPNKSTHGRPKWLQMAHIVHLSKLQPPHNTKMIPWPFMDYAFQWQSVAVSALDFHNATQENPWCGGRRKYSCYLGGNNVFILRMTLSTILYYHYPLPCLNSQVSGSISIAA